jgi:hypothetical protein
MLVLEGNMWGVVEVGEVEIRDPPSHKAMEGYVRNMRYEIRNKSYE